MKNKIFIIIFLFWSNSLMSETLNIKSSSITIDKKTEMTQFKGNVIAKDEENNILKTEHAEYDKDLNILFAKGKTEIITSRNFLQGEDIIFDNKNNLIKSNKPTIIKDLENNEIFLEKFEYSTINKLFKSSGKIKVMTLEIIHITFHKCLSMKK